MSTAENKPDTLQHLKKRFPVLPYIFFMKFDYVYYNLTFMKKFDQMSLQNIRHKEETIAHFLENGIGDRVVFYPNLNFDDDFYRQTYMSSSPHLENVDAYFHFVTEGIVAKAHPNGNAFIASRFDVTTGGSAKTYSMPLAPVDGGVTRWTDRLEATINLLASEGVAVDIRPENVDFCTAAHDYFASKNEHEKSLLIIQKALRASQHSYDIVLRYAKALERKGVFTLAADYYAQCLPECPAGERDYIEAKIARCRIMLGEGVGAAGPLDASPELVH